MFSRRGFLKTTLGAAAVASISARVQAQRGGRRERIERPVARRGRLIRKSHPGYGPLRSARDQTTGLPLLDLPAGFEYFTFGWINDRMTDGHRVPSSHDGSGVFDAGGGRLHVIRNHEIGPVPTAFAPARAYDAGAGGGCTVATVDLANRRVLDSWAALSGTLNNCGGTATPWGTWLTCEESTGGAPARHGYVFEVSPVRPQSPAPLRALGRFVHEGVVVDPVTGTLYMTEDTPIGGLYRFLPNRRTDLTAGGTLQILGVRGRAAADLRRHSGRDALPVEWFTIPEVDPADPVGNSVFAQGVRLGGAAFAGNEGMVRTGGRVYFASTSGGAAGCGQIWSYDPGAETLSLWLDSPQPEVLDHPDTLAVSPRGTLLSTEEGAEGQSLVGFDPAGFIFPFATNRTVLDGTPHGFRGDFSWSDVTGPVFSPDGKWLFFNVQWPGYSVAVTGPWEAGSL